MRLVFRGRDLRRSPQPPWLLPGEIWRRSKIAPDYEVSNLGRVRALAKKVNRFRFGRMERFVKRGRYSKGQMNNCGYHAMNLRVNGKMRRFYLHRLVGELFVPNPDNKPCINHKDGNKLNNNPSNLEWVTYAENTQHAYRTGLMPKTHKRRTG